jgi:hypothetical protein
MRLGDEAQMKADEQLAQDEADMKAAVESLAEDENGEKIELKSAGTTGSRRTILSFDRRTTPSP